MGRGGRWAVRWFEGGLQGSGGGGRWEEGGKRMEEFGE